SSQSSYISHFFLFILFLSYGALRNLPSFPTRRSSDLAVRHGRDELRRRVGDLEKQAVGVLRLLGVLPEEPEPPGPAPAQARAAEDRKSTRLNSSHVKISYAVFCLKKKT